MDLTFIRHGQTDWNKAKRLMGQIDIELNDEGVREIYEILSQLNPGFDIVYSSPLKRSYRTAEIISRHINTPIILKDELKERDFGSLAGKTWEEVSEQVGQDLKAIDREQEYDYRPYGGESAEQIKTRLLKFIDVVKDADFDKALVVCHGGIIRMMHFLFSDDIPKIGNASIHEFRC